MWWYHEYGVNKCYVVLKLRQFHNMTNDSQELQYEIIKHCGSPGPATQVSKGYASSGFFMLSLLILDFGKNKRSIFYLDICFFFLQEGLFSSYSTLPNRQYSRLHPHSTKVDTLQEKGSILSPQEFFLLCGCQCSVEKWSHLSPQKSAFRKKGSIFLLKRS